MMSSKVKVIVQSSRSEEQKSSATDGMTDDGIARVEFKTAKK